MISLKRKLTFSYGLLIIVIFAVSAWSVYHLLRLGRAIDVILINNYKSILAAENMKEALERQDSAAMFFIASHAEQAKKQFDDNAAKFDAEYQIAASNITEVGEAEIIADIDARYRKYRNDLKEFLNSNKQVPAAELSAGYFVRLGPDFLSLKTRIDDLLHLNQQAMVSANDRAIAVSRRAEMSTAAMAALALTLALLFAWRFTRYVVSPITALTEKARRIGEGDLEQYIEISSKDEIGLLASEFNRMAQRLRSLRKSDYGRLLLEQKKSDAVIDSLYEPVIVTDAQGHVTKMNRAARVLFAEPGGNGKRRGPDVSFSDLAGGDQILRAVRSANSMQQPVAAEADSALVPLKVGDAERNFRLRATPVRDGEGRMMGAVTLLEDVTSIRELDKLKTDFISVASSKLREPLRSLQLALHAVVEGHAGDLNEEQLDLLSSARENAGKLDELMSDLLELAEIESGSKKLSPQRLRPVEMAREAVAAFQFEAESKRITLENKVWPDLSWVIADRRAVRRVFDNLLSNAIRHTPRDGHIVVEAREGVDRIVFGVRDTGEGIAEDRLPSLFGRFVQLTERADGHGLGLALVKRLVEAQRGEVSVQSRPGEGSTFTFSLPIGGPFVAYQGLSDTEQQS